MECNIKECSNNIEYIKKIQNSKEFFYQKLVDLFEEFENYPIDNQEIDKLIKDTKEQFDNFKNFIKQHKQHEKFLELIGKIISIIDTKAANKKEWNPYEDKRALAQTGVYQDKWLINLLLYKKNSLNASTINASTIINTIKFIKDPENNITQLSERHKRLVAKNLLKKDYNPQTFVDDLKECFKNELKKYPLKNPKNIGVLLGAFLYCDEIREIWDKENKKKTKIIIPRKKNQ
jgi:5-methylcytosine-specific restriction protein B